MRGASGPSPETRGLDDFFEFAAVIIHFFFFLFGVKNSPGLVCPGLMDKLLVYRKKRTQ